SKAAAERGWFEAERDATLMQQFRERKERILPVRLEAVTPPHLLGAIAYVDLFPNELAFTAGIVRLTRSIAVHEASTAPQADNASARLVAVASSTADQVMQIPDGWGARGGEFRPINPMPLVITSTSASAMPISSLAANRVATPTPSYPNRRVQALS